MNLKQLVGSAVVVGLVAMGANADLYTFDCITPNASSANIQTGQDQFSLEVTEYGTQVRFNLKNTGTNKSSITAIYFADVPPVDLTFASFIQDATKVKFNNDGTVSPTVLPDGNTVGFVAAYAYDDVAPVPKNGINNGEELGMVFNYANGQTFQSILNNLNSGELKIGMHVQAFADGKSASFVNALPKSSVPEPSILTLLGLSLLGVGFIRRKVK